MSLKSSLRHTKQNAINYHNLNVFNEKVYRLLLTTLVHDRRTVEACCGDVL
jgi:hypothetical protein